MPTSAVEITLKKLASLGSGRLRGVVVAPNVTSRQYRRRAISVSGDVRFQYSDYVDPGILGDRFVPSSSVSQCLHLRLRTLP